MDIIISPCSAPNKKQTSQTRWVVVFTATDPVEYEELDHPPMWDDIGRFASSPTRRGKKWVIWDWQTMDGIEFVNPHWVPDGHSRLPDTSRNRTLLQQAINSVGASAKIWNEYKYLRFHIPGCPDAAAEVYELMVEHWRRGELEGCRTMKYPVRLSFKYDIMGGNVCEVAWHLCPDGTKIKTINGNVVETIPEDAPVKNFEGHSALIITDQVMCCYEY